MKRKKLPKRFESVSLLRNSCDWRLSLVFNLTFPDKTWTFLDPPKGHGVFPCSGPWTRVTEEFPDGFAGRKEFSKQSCSQRSLSFGGRSERSVVSVTTEAFPDWMSGLRERGRATSRTLRNTTIPLLGTEPGSSSVGFWSLAWRRFCRFCALGWSWQKHGESEQEHVSWTAFGPHLSRCWSDTLPSWVKLKNPSGFLKVHPGVPAQRNVYSSSALSFWSKTSFFSPVQTVEEIRIFTALQYLLFLIWFDWFI